MKLVYTHKAFVFERYQILQILKQEPLNTGLPSDAAQRGSIVNTASICGLDVIGTLAAYNSSKHAVVQFSVVDARDFAQDRIRINTVCPGFVKTPLPTGSNLSQVYLDADLDAAKGQAPMNRILQPVEIADASIVLSSSKATCITGLSLPVDCGAQLFHVIWL